MEHGELRALRPFQRGEQSCGLSKAHLSLQRSRLRRLPGHTADTVTDTGMGTAIIMAGTAIVTTPTVDITAIMAAITPGGIGITTAVTTTRRRSTATRRRRACTS